MKKVLIVTGDACEALPVQPPQGSVGTRISITGTGFGTKRGTVKIGTAACNVSSWSATSVACTVNKALRAGRYNVTLKPPGGASTVTYTVCPLRVIFW